ncbi:hypothetical protein LshimejAT787_0503660 [Lyophyllum shimeji]|uniref:Uncharacterized protein n=1 Tax=Lyophyllum shimeji TaxID=47721 RepID=A0A9P3UPP9_LYOSH|nr:hypothetical protein LshimejAT787_0503660 [Lyophyllum shimeji]
MAFAVPQEGNFGILFLLIVSVEYGSRKSPSIRTICQSALPQHWRTARALFLCKDVVGVIPYFDGGSSPSILAINYVQNVSVSIPLTQEHFMNNNTDLFCSDVNGTSFIVISDVDMYWVYRVSTGVLPSGVDSEWEDGATVNDPGSVVPVAEIYAPETEGSYDREVPDVSWSPQGLHALHIFYGTGAVNLSGIHSTRTRTSLWPMQTLHRLSPSGHGQDIASATTVVQGTVGSYLGSEGLHAPWLVASSESGIYSVAIIHCDDDDLRQTSRLHLFQYDSCSPEIWVRQLALPVDIGIHEIFAIAMDERLGIIYLSHVQGRLLVMTYA